MRARSQIDSTEISNGQNENTTQNDEQELNWTEQKGSTAQQHHRVIIIIFFSLNTLTYYSARSQNNYTTQSVVKWHL